jgi:hypothetical protein
MSKQNLEKTLRRELEVLNDVIDRKIIKGLSYTREARRHKFLLSSIANLHRTFHTSSSWFSKSFGLVSTFLF